MADVTAIVVAAGRSERFGGERPKVLVPWRGRTLLSWTLSALDACPDVDDVVLVASPPVEHDWVESGRAGDKVRVCVPGGSTRQESVARGLAALPARAGIVLVHDAARPFVSAGLITRVVDAARRSGAAVPLLAVADTVKRVAPEGDGFTVLETLEREALALAQTPQGFRRDVLTRAHAHAEAERIEATDDASLVEAALRAGALGPGLRVEGVAGEPANVKVTRPHDLPRGAAETRVGLGHDVHALEPGLRFVLAGIDLHEGLPASARFGPRGHSDGDAVVHALCDAMLGALGLGDIGQHFSDTDPAHAGRASLEFLAHVHELTRTEGWRVSNASLVVRLERPRLAPHALALRERMASVLGVPVSAVGLSAKRGEGMGPVGEGRAIACEAVVLMERVP